MSAVWNPVPDSRRRQIASSRTDTFRTEWQEEQDTAVAILDIGGVNDGVEQQTQRIYKKVALLAFDLLARIKAMRIDTGPPFSALLTLWLSMMAAVGLASCFLAHGTPHKARDECDRARRRSSTSRDSRAPCCVGVGLLIARHWHPVLKTYMIPFITSRSSTWRLLPPRLAGGINGSISAHSSSVRSLGYRNALRSYRPRFFDVHIGDPPRNQATTLESQTTYADSICSRTDTEK